MKNRVVTILSCCAAMAVCLLAAGCPDTRPAPEPVVAAAAPAAVPALESAPIEICPAPVVVEAPPLYQPIAGRTVILDAGHGGDDFGACHFGLQEKDINLDLARRVATSLRAEGVNVVMTRDSDVFVPLPDRCKVANRSPNAVFVSVHVNASDKNPNATGIETYVLTSAQSDAERGKLAAAKYRVSNSDPVQGKHALATLTAQSRNRGPILADCVQRTLVARMGDVNRGVKTGNLAVLRETYFCPAVLVEVGFVSNPSVALAMRTDEWRRRTADALAQGIADYLRQPE